MKEGRIYVSELSASKHIFSGYHFCRGNSNRRKSRIGIIIKGSGSYIYLNKRLEVKEGDTVFIPEDIYCYSEWRGSPEIEVLYVSCFMHYEQWRYEPQIIGCGEEAKGELMQIAELLSGDYIEELEAYSLFYKLLQSLLPQMVRSEIVYGKTLQTAIEYITDNWNINFPIGDLAKKCCVSESTLYHLFQKELGQTPLGFQNSIRINVAMEYLEDRSYSVATVSRLVGFNSENHFRKVFTDIIGTTPLRYRKRR